MKRHKPMEAKDDIRETPDSLFNSIDQRFHFDLDVCATARNRKCREFFDEQQDGLRQSWAGRVCWCNPPFTQLEDWIVKSWESRAELVYLLMPGTRCEQRFWQTWVEPFRDGRGVADGTGMELTTEFIAGRHKFLDENGLPILGRNGKEQQPMFGLVGLIFERII